MENKSFIIESPKEFTEEMLKYSNPKEVQNDIIDSLASASYYFRTCSKCGSAINFEESCYMQKESGIYIICSACFKGD